MKKTTEWREWDDKGHRYRARVKYGFDAAKHNQAPYFSITQEWAEDSFGVIGGNSALTLFPNLMPLLKWHLCAVGEGPMHYVADGLYWWEQGATGGWNAPVNKYTRGLPLDYFKSTVVYGALPSDADFDPMRATLTKREVRAWLENRLPELLTAFYEDMERAGVEVPE